MKKIIIFVVAVVCWSTTAVAGHLGLGLRAGPAIAVQDFSDSAGMNIGPAIDAQISYNMLRFFEVGLDVNYETHSVSSSGSHLGRNKTVSLMPFALLRLLPAPLLSPYVSLGVGLNVNTFSESSNLSASGLSINPSNTFAIKPAVGIDAFITRHFALNAELGWKRNLGSVNTNVPGFGLNFNASTLQMLFGAKIYF